MKILISVILGLSAISIFAADFVRPTSAQVDAIHRQAKILAEAVATSHIQKFLELAQKQNFEISRERTATAYEVFYGVAKENANRRLAEDFYEGRAGVHHNPTVIMVNTTPDPGNATYLSLIAETFGFAHVYYDMNHKPDDVRLRQDLMDGSTLILNHYSSFHRAFLEKGNFNYFGLLIRDIRQGDAIVLAVNDESSAHDPKETGITYSTPRDEFECGSAFIISPDSAARLKRMH
jgi:hypothetical protein